MSENIYPRNSLPTPNEGMYECEGQLGLWEIEQQLVLFDTDDTVLPEERTEATVVQAEAVDPGMEYLEQERLRLAEAPQFEGMLRTLMLDAHQQLHDQAISPRLEVWNALTHELQNSMPSHIVFKPGVDDGRLQNRDGLLQVTWQYEHDFYDELHQGQRLLRYQVEGACRLPVERDEDTWPLAEELRRAAELLTSTETAVHKPSELPEFSLLEVAPSRMPGLRDRYAFPNEVLSRAIAEHAPTLMDGVRIGLRKPTDDRYGYHEVYDPSIQTFVPGTVVKYRDHDVVASRELLTMGQDVHDETAQRNLTAYGRYLYQNGYRSLDECQAWINAKWVKPWSPEDPFDTLNDAARILVEQPLINTLPTQPTYLRQR